MKQLQMKIDQKLIVIEKLSEIEMMPIKACKILRKAELEEIIQKPKENI
jgi:hypothetical protein